MKNLISISNGFGYRIFNDRNETMRFLRDFPIDGIELMLIDKFSIAELELDQNVEKYLKASQYSTIHAPFFDYKNDKKTKGVLTLIKQLYDRINAKNVTFHPDNIIDYTLLAKCGFRVSIENNDKRKNLGFQKPEEIASLLSKYPFLSFTFDFGHAFAVNSDDIDSFLKLKDRMSQIHLSYCSDTLSEHVFLFNNQSPELIANLKKLSKELQEGVPIVFESVALTEKDMTLLQQEINFVREL